ncbi:MAG: hypothetical protein K0R49_1689 [Burkholderiales bacterium]|jgi:hypothetical protein|nr:hypothetical protein [Burkholderiales bacterium]
MPFWHLFLMGYSYMNNYLKLYGSLSLLLIVNGCALFDSSQKRSNRPVSVPRVNQIISPGGNDKNWRYLGLSDDGQLIVEINDKSITTSNRPQVYDYQDRKTVVEPSKFTAYTTGQPHYKFLLSNWQMDCNLKQYLILNTIIYDSSAIELLRYDYTTNNNIKWMKIGKGSLAELQYNYICLNQKRKLGY